MDGLHEHMRNVLSGGEFDRDARKAELAKRLDKWGRPQTESDLYRRGFLGSDITLRDIGIIKEILGWN